MKRQLSLGMLYARSSLWRVLGIFLIMAVCQLALGWFTLRDNAQIVWETALETVLDGGWFRLFSALGLTGAVAAVILSAGGFGSRVDYAVSRLPVRRIAVWGWAAGYGAAVMVLFWAVELAVCLGVFRIFAAVSPSAAHNPQLLLLAAYRSSLFHSLLPLRDGARWTATALYFLGLGVLTGTWAVRAFGGKWSAVPLIAAMAWWFPAGAVGSVGWAIFLAVLTLTVTFFTVWNFWEVEKS